MMQLWECSPPTNVSQVRFPDLASYVGWVCWWFSTLLQAGFSPGTPVFPSPQKPTFPNFNWICIHRHFWMSSCELLGAPWVNKLHVYILQITYLHIYIHTFYSTLYMYGMLTTDTPKFKPLYILWYKILDMYVDVWQQYSVWLWIS